MDTVIASLVSALTPFLVRGLEANAGAVRPLLVPPLEGLAPSGGLVTPNSVTPPVDLEIQVDFQPISDSRSQLTYVLHSPSGKADYHFYKLEPKVVEVSPEGYAERLIAKIEAIRQRKKSKTVTSPEEELKQLGRELYEQLFPLALKQAYVDFRSKIDSLQITSNEGWIPWEIVCVYEDQLAHSPIDDEPLCLQFSLTRWVAGQVAPKPSIEVGTLATLAAQTHESNAELPAVGGESKYMADFASTHGLRDMSADGIETLLNGHGIDLWHFATHGTFDPADPTQARLTLPGGTYFRAADLSGSRRTRMREDRPMVVLNACDAGKVAPGLTQLGGWANAWVRDCHAGAFIGPLWQVSDTPAFSFMSGFYSNLLAHQTIGQAVRDSRLALRANDPGDPTWLAYSVYAHPNARVHFHGHQSDSADVAV